jgi:hypothetical protein
MARWKAALACVSAALVCVLGMASVGCSGSGDSEDAGAHDASHDVLPRLGVGEPNCTSDTCWPPATCAGFLLGPNQPVTYCTLVCGDSGAACPSGTVCANRGIGQCLKACAQDSDCAGGFGCKVDAGYCFSLYTGSDSVRD